MKTITVMNRPSAYQVDTDKISEMEICAYIYYYACKHE